MATAGMSAEENKDPVRRYIEECWNRHNIDATDELVSPDYLNHAASPEYQRAGAKYSLNWFFSVFPDHRFDIEDAVAEGDTVAVRGTMGGTHEGELLGILQKPQPGPNSLRAFVSAHPAEPRSHTNKRTGLRSASFGYCPDFPLIPPGCASPHGSSWADRTGTMDDLAHMG